MIVHRIRLAFIARLNQEEASEKSTTKQGLLKQVLFGVGVRKHTFRNVLKILTVAERQICYPKAILRELRRFLLVLKLEFPCWKNENKATQLCFAPKVCKHQKRDIVYYRDICKFTHGVLAGPAGR